MLILSHNRTVQIDVSLQLSLLLPFSCDTTVQIVWLIVVIRARIPIDFFVWTLARMVRQLQPSARNDFKWCDAQTCIFRIMFWIFTSYYYEISSRISFHTINFYSLTIIADRCGYVLQCPLHLRHHAQSGWWTVKTLQHTSRHHHTHLLLFYFAKKKFKLYDRCSGLRKSVKIHNTMLDIVRLTGYSIPFCSCCLTVQVSVQTESIVIGAHIMIISHTSCTVVSQLNGRNTDSTINWCA